MRITGKMQLRRISLILCACFLLNSFLPAVWVRAEEETSASAETEIRSADSEDRLSYYYYIRNYSDAAKPDIQIDIDLTPIEEQTDDGCVSTYAELEGSKSGLRFGGEKGYVTFRVQVPESGLYLAELKYLALIDTAATIITGLKIDGEVPYGEAASCALSRTYQNGDIRKDNEGNDLRPYSEQVSVWRTSYLRDQAGVNGELYFYLEQGEHLISLYADGVPFLLEQFSLRQKEYVMSYADYLTLHEQNGAKKTTGVSEKIQAENYLYQSDSTLWPLEDKTNPLMEPFDYATTRLNIAGGTQWKQVGQWISWEITVPADGFYHIGIKYRQNYLDGLYSSRKIMIDGAVPFEELSRVRFDYTTSWEMQTLSDEQGTPYEIYLTAGTHTLTMENVMGDLSSLIDTLQTAVSDLNDLYLSVVMVTGSDPDPYRDYYVKRHLPELPDNLRACAQMLFEEAARLVEQVGERGSESAFLEDIAYSLESYAENVENFTYKNRLADLKTNITSLSSKLQELNEQALDIDYFVIASGDVKMPRTKANLWEGIVYQVKSFITSFTKAKAKNSEGAVRVWMSGGNDQLQILQDLITDEFTAKTGITVDLELVPGTLVEAVVSGEGPDVSIGVDADTVVNLALRGALTDLQDYPGFDELKEEYIEGSYTPFTLEGKVYGIPNVNAFNMLFVRTDIFEELNIDVPKSIDDIYDITQVLQGKNMKISLSPGFASMLYQRGGSYFNDDLTAVAFDSEVAVRAFEESIEFVTKYGHEITFDFVTLFRSGEMPIGIQQYSTYNTLKYSAPEINGLWEMYVVPGTKMDDGTINYTQADSGGTGTVLLNINNNEEKAWEFIKWWSGWEVQARYGNDLEAVMGTAQRYQTANVKTLDALAWTEAEKRVLFEQIQYMTYIPIVPGNYYIGRGITNATRAVQYDGKNAREMLTSWTIKINEEITRKRAEFYKNNK